MEDNDVENFPLLPCNKRKVVAVEVDNESSTLKPEMPQENLLQFPSMEANNFEDQTDRTNTLSHTNCDFIASSPETSDKENCETESFYECRVSSRSSHTNGDSRKGPTVTCRICQNEMQLETRNIHVVRCEKCHEVTPIRAPPPGKKYVRCPCNCLLICKASSSRIGCPRTNCRRVITMTGTTPVGTAVRAPAGTCRVQCCHCGEMFMFNTLLNVVAHCPHCSKSSSVGINVARSRTVIYGVLFGILFFVFVGVVLGTYSMVNVFIYSFWLTLLVGQMYCFYQFIYYFRLKVSQVLGPL